MSESVAPIDHIDRWRRLVIARREQHDAVCAAQGRTTDDYWARRADGFRKFARATSAAGDPFLEIVQRHMRPEDTVLDVGAGTGRHAIPMASRARSVTALDPSPAMLRFLREDAAAADLDNVTVVEGEWPEAAAQVPEVDIAISAHVLYPIEEVVSFLGALDHQARRICILHLMVWQPWFDLIGLWEAVHGEERLPQPTAIDAVNVLHQLGCHANMEVNWVDTPRPFDDMDDAMDRFAESMAVGEDAERRGRLRKALSARLRALGDGRLAFEEGRYPVATVWWEAGALAPKGADG